MQFSDRVQEIILVGGELNQSKNKILTEMSYFSLLKWKIFKFSYYLTSILEEKRILKIFLDKWLEGYQFNLFRNVILYLRINTVQVYLFNYVQCHA